MDTSIADTDTSRRGLTAGMPAGNSSSPASEGRDAYSGGRYDDDDDTATADRDISNIPQHKRWANVPMRYAYRIDNPNDANIFSSPDESWSWRTFFSYCGPGFLVAIAYLDPGNLEANLQVSLSVSRCCVGSSFLISSYLNYLNLSGRWQLL